jgi:hypothetical protein
VGLAALYAGAWQFYLLLLLRILTAILKQPLLVWMQWLRSPTQKPGSLGPS